MPRVVCTLPNASHLINGVKFGSRGEEAGGGMVSEEIPDHIAAEFLAIRGYALHEMPSTTGRYDKSGEAKAADKADSKLRAVPATQQKESA